MMNIIEDDMISDVLFIAIFMYKTCIMVKVGSCGKKVLTTTSYHCPLCLQFVKDRVAN